VIVKKVLAERTVI
jgi:hypothetical protein